MKNLLRLLVLTTAVGCVVVGCGQDGGDSGGSGGTTSGSGGNGSGGATGSGGKGSGGSASGGSVGSGGSTGSGGASSGGATGSGGASSGGATGSGGASSGGAIGSGGASSGGATGSGGASSGGATGSGGASSGGATGSGGATHSGGSTGSGGGGLAGRGGAGAGGPGGATSIGGAGGGASGSYNPCPTNGDPCKILPLGDSITYGLITGQADRASSDASINGKDSHGGYRVKLFSDAVATGQKITFTGSVMNGPSMVSGMAFPPDNEGHSGYTIDSSNGNGINVKTLLDRAFQPVPQIILLHIGTNDVNASSGQSGMADRLTALIDEVARRAPGALIVVSTIIPLKPAAAALTAYNAKIPDVVSKEVTAGHHVVLVDMYTGFDVSLLSGDGVHPNQMGYDRMGDKFYAAVSSLLPK